MPRCDSSLRYARTAPASAVSMARARAWQKAAIVGEIAPVGIERVSARAALDRHHLEEGLAPWPAWHGAGRLTGH